MRYYIGLDISDASTNVHVLDRNGTIVKKLTTKTDPKSLDLAFRQLNMPIEKIGLETGPKSNWLIRELREKGWSVVLQDSFKMAKIIETKVNKTDDNDAHIIAEVTLAGSLIPNFLNMAVHLKSPESEDIKTLIRVRQSILRQNVEIYNRVRGLLKAYGKEVPKTSHGAFTKTVAKYLEGLSFEVQLSIASLIQPYDPNRKLLDTMDNHLNTLANKNETAQVVDSIREVGTITALYLMACIDDPTRFKKSRSVGAYFGLCPFQYSSGQKHQQGKISKRGDEVARSLLIGAATRILKPSAEPCPLKTQGQALIKRCGKGKATVAIARKLAILIHRMMVTKKPYTEEMMRPKVKKAPIKLTSEEILHLAKLAEKEGHIEFRSAQHIKTLSKGTEVNHSKPKAKSQPNKLKKHKRKTTHR